MIKIKQLIEIVKKAGDIIMQHYHSDQLKIQYKADLSPVSVADLEANDFICHSLNKLYPNIPIISEENDYVAQYHSQFWSIDPLDGTKSFIKHNNEEFTVNIALIETHLPVIGIVYSPLTNQLYYTDRDAIPYKQENNQPPKLIQARIVPKLGSTVLASISSIKQKKLHQYLMDKQIAELISMSSSLKICLIAEGKADLYPRFGKTMEWDTAAGHAILNAAGGSIKNLAGRTLTYGHPERQYYNPEFIAMGLSE